MFMRAYAFTCRQTVVIAILLPIYAALVALSIWTYAWNNILRQSPLDEWLRAGCVPGAIRQTQFASMGAVLGTTALLDFLSLLIVLKHAIRTQTLDSRLGQTFVFQGLCNFGIVLTINTVAAGVYFRGLGHYGLFWFTFSLVLTNVVSHREVLTRYQGRKNDPYSAFTSVTDKLCHSGKAFEDCS
ncbi:hypothetical protein ONZ45_g5344 [Pleurotus djamor]|nr:hypothetical protein ONZ45_g8098 [Pleurotus djamor]KAJ8517465.1 hypothetical protein ONZ45_g5344 [Pleurotus djamor]